MNKQIFTLGIILIFAFGMQKANAQNNYTIVSAKEQGTYAGSPVSNLTLCTQYKFTYTITASAAPSSDKVTINLPYGITYSSFTSSSGGTVNYLSGTTSPVFNVTGWTGTTLIITIVVQTPSCSWSPANPQSTYTTISGRDCLNNNYPVSTFFSPGTPNLEITPLIHTSYNNAWLSGSYPLNVNPGETGEIVFKLENTGDGEIENINLNYTTTGSNVIIMSPGYCTSTAQTPCGSYINIPAANTNDILLSPSDFNSLLGHPLFSQKDTPIYVHFYFKINNNCVNSSAQFNFSLGCGNTNCHTYTYNTQFIIQPGMPNIVASDINNLTTPSITNSDGCENTQAARTAIMGFVFTNSGTPLTGAGAPPATNARATDLKVIFSVDRALASIDSSTFIINNTLHVPASWVTEFYQTKTGYYTYQIDLTNNNLQDFGSNSLTDFNGNGIYDQLAEGKTFTVTVNYIYNNFNTQPPADFSTGGEDVPLIADAKYNNEFCTLTGSPVMPLSNQPSSLNVIGFFSYDHIPSTNASITDSTGPNVTSSTANNEPGPNFELSICPGNYEQAWGSAGAPADYHFACPNADYQAVIEVPTNYMLNLSDPTYSLVPTPCPAYAATAGACGCYKFSSSSPQVTAYSFTSPTNTVVVSPIIEDYTACAAKCSGPNKIVVDFKNLMDPNPPYNYAYDINCFKVPVTLACNCDSASNSWDNFTLNYNYLCDPSSASSNCNTALASANTQLSHHCGSQSGSSQSGAVKGGSSIFTTSYELYFERATLGWDYNNGGNDWDSAAPMSHLVDTTKAAIRRDRAYPGDEIEEKLNGSYAAAAIKMGSVYLQTSWQEIASLGGIQTFLNFEASKSKFILVDGTNRLTCTATCNSYLSGGSVVYDVQLDAAGVAFINLHNTDNVSISADIFWVVKTSPLGGCWPGTTIFCPGAYPMQQLQAGFYGKDTANGIYTPDNVWAANFEILQPVVQQWYDNGSTSVTYCQDVQGEVTTRMEGGLYGKQQDDFPNEFRPYVSPLGPVYITVPTGYTYQPGSGLLTAYVDKYVNNPSTNYIAPQTTVLYTVAVAPTNTIAVPGGTQYEFQPHWPLLDGKYGSTAPYVSITYSVMPVCSAPTPSYFIAKAQYQTSVQQYDTNIRKSPGYGLIVEGLGHNAMDTTVINEHQINPQIEIACPALSPTVLSNTTTFTITISNNSGHNAPDAWISLQQITAANLWKFDTNSVWHTTISSGTQLHTVHAYNDNSHANDLFIDYGPLANGSTDIIIVQAKTNPSALAHICDNTNFVPDTNTIDVLYGNECTYKSITSPDNSCQQGASSFRVNWYPSTVSLTQLSSPTSIDLCSKQYSYTFSINNNDAGTTVNPMFWANIPSGLTIAGATFSYTDQSHRTYTATATSVLGNSFGTCTCEPGWNVFDNSLIPQLSSSGEGFQGGTSILVTLVLQTSCAYAGAPINFYASGATSCGYILAAPQITSVPDSTYSSCSVALTTSQTNTKCYGDNAGTATVYATGAAPFTYLWNTTPAQTTQTATGLSAGTYKVTVTNATGCSYNTTVTIIGASSPITASVLSRSDVTCNGGNNGKAEIKVSGGVSPYTYLWNPGGESAETEAELTAATYTVKVTDANGCLATVAANITQPTALNVSIAGPHLVCSGSDAALVSHVSGGKLPYTYLWSSGATTNDVSVTPVNSTTYTLTVTDANGCLKATTIRVETNSPLNVAVSGATEFCRGGSATLTASASGGNGNYSFVWLPVKDSAKSVTVSPDSTSTYTVEVTDGCGTSMATASAKVTVNAVPDVSFMANHVTGCVPLCIQFKDLSTSPSGDIAKWVWSFGNGDSSTSANPYYCYPDTGSFNISLTAVSKNGCRATLKKSNMVSVYSRPKASFTFSPQPVSLQNPEVQFTSNSYGQYPIKYWYWNFGDGSDSNSSLVNPTHRYYDTGTFCTRLIVVDEHGCVDSVTNCVVVNSDFTFYIPDAFTPNGDGLNDVFAPKGSYVKDYEMTIYDRWGMKIFSSNDFNTGWNGKVNNSSQICQEDTYVYVINLTDSRDNKHSYMGKVSLLK